MLCVRVSTIRLLREETMSSDSAEGGGAGIGLCWRAAFCAAEKSYGRGQRQRDQARQSIPYSGPASAFSVVGRVQVAYFKMLNAQGGINGARSS